MRNVNNFNPIVHGLFLHSWFHGGYFYRNVLET